MELTSNFNTYGINKCLIIFSIYSNLSCLPVSTCIDRNTNAAHNFPSGNCSWSWWQIFVTSIYDETNSFGSLLHTQTCIHLKFCRIPNRCVSILPQNGVFWLVFCFHPRFFPKNDEKLLLELLATLLIFRGTFFPVPFSSPLGIF